MARRKKNIMNKFFNQDENQELENNELEEETNASSKISDNLFESEKDGDFGAESETAKVDDDVKPENPEEEKIEEIIEEEPIEEVVIDEKTKVDKVEEEPVVEEKPQKKLTDRMKRRLGIV